MKREMSLLIVLHLGVAVKSFAGTGNASDVSVLFLIIGGLLAFLLGLFMGVDFLRKNGKTILCKTMSFLKNRISLLKKFRQKGKSSRFDLSYF